VDTPVNHILSSTICRPAYYSIHKSYYESLSSSALIYLTVENTDSSISYGLYIIIIIYNMIQCVRRFYRAHYNSCYCPEWFRVFAASKHCLRIFRKTRRSSLIYSYANRTKMAGSRSPTKLNTPS